MDPNLSLGHLSVHLSSGWTSFLGGPQCEEHQQKGSIEFNHKSQGSHWGSLGHVPISQPITVIQRMEYMDLSPLTTLGLSHPQFGEGSPNYVV